jgi:hypothetical protein
MTTQNYSEDFYSMQRDGSSQSASYVLPIVFEVLRPASVVDVGCGVGTWLSAAKGLGSKRLVGFEGAWITTVPKPDQSIEIRVVDLEKDLRDYERFDLAICMEVAEHLSSERAPSLVRDLCGLSDCVLFSAAIPGQGGENHINEQWQSYWVNLFDSMNYAAIDIIRPALWRNEHVEFWYRQNSFLYISRSRLGSLGLTETRPALIDIAHPIIVEAKTRRERPTAHERLTKAISAVRRLGLRTKLKNLVRKTAPK